MKEFEAKKKILGFLREKKNDFVSGENMSEALGFSRASAWKYIKKLQDEGYVIEAASRKGYRLKSSPDKVYGHDIASVLNTKTIGRNAIYHYESTTSTNDVAYELAENGEPEGAIVIAETQTHGKGRMKRQWLSPRTGGIYASIILRPNMDINEISAISIVAAMAVARSIKETCGLKPKIKWPNDVLINEKKVCGILTEIKAQPDMIDFLILGVGINVNTSTKQLPDEGTSLKIECAQHVDRMKFLKILLKEFEDVYTRFQKEGFSPLREECKILSSFLGRHVKIDAHHRSIEGEATDIDERGALIVKTNTGSSQRILSGDVVLCR